MSNPDKLKSLVQQAASAITMADVKDLSDIEQLQSVFDDIAACVNEISDLPDPLKDQTTGATSSAGDTVKELLAEESSDAEASLKAISDTVVALQSLTEQIEKGTEGCDLSVEFPATSDAADATVTEDVAVSDSQVEVESSAPAVADVTDDPSDDFLIADDDIELVADFINEANEHIESAEAGLLELDSDPDDSESINLIFRAFHTIKGMAGFLNLADLGSLAHAAENLLDLGRKGELQLVGPNMDVIFESLDLLKVMISELKDAVETTKIVPGNSNLSSLVVKLNACAAGQVIESKSPRSSEETAAAPEPAKSSTAAEETEAAKTVEPTGVETPAEPESVVEEAATASQEAAPVEVPAAATPQKAAPVEAPAAAASQKAVAKPKQQAATEEKIKVSTSRLDNLVNMVGELVIAQSMVSQEANGALKADHDLCRQIGHQGKIVRELQELSMMMRMVPIQGVFQKMARLVRDLCQKSGKKVVFTTEGEDTELDRIVVDQIADPLVHMIRNSIDHGVESEEDRVKAGKDVKGSVRLRAFHQAGNIVIEIIDDGKGLDKDKILQKAIDNGLVQAGQDLSDQEIYKLIFSAGLSTAAKVTEISGRGVGMDVVRKNIEALRGKVDIDSRLGKGTTFTIRLPLTMAIIDGQVVRIGSERYIIPIVSIEHSFRPSKSQIKTVRGQAEIASIHGELLPMVRLYNVLGVKPDTEIPMDASLVVVEEDGVKGCLMVDELLGQQQVVIKSLGEGVGMIKGVSGAAIMGDGRVRLIFDIPGLLEIAWR
jgi:two-component system chemotaxis sensor kinase CheA